MRARCGHWSRYSHVGSSLARSWPIPLRSSNPRSACEELERPVSLLTRDQYLRVASTLYAPCILFLKLSILFQYIRIFMPNRQPRVLYWSTILLAGANAVSYLVLLLMQIWSCTPMRKSWDPLVTGGYCLDTSALNVSASSINVISDVAIFILPQAVIWRLNMPLRQKIQVSTIFLIAAL